jgi:hypothetical protein
MTDSDRKEAGELVMKIRRALGFSSRKVLAREVDGKDDQAIKNFELGTTKSVTALHQRIFNFLLQESSKKRNSELNIRPLLERLAVLLDIPLKKKMHLSSEFREFLSRELSHRSNRDQIRSKKNN